MTTSLLADEHTEEVQRISRRQVLDLVTARENGRHLAHLRRERLVAATRARHVVDGGEVGEQRE